MNDLVVKGGAQYGILPLSEILAVKGAELGGHVSGRRSDLHHDGDGGEFQRETAGSGAGSHQVHGGARSHASHQSEGHGAKLDRNSGHEPSMSDVRCAAVR